MTERERKRRYLVNIAISSLKENIKEYQNSLMDPMMSNLNFGLQPIWEIEEFAKSKCFERWLNAKNINGDDRFMFGLNGYYLQLNNNDIDMIIIHSKEFVMETIEEFGYTIETFDDELTWFEIVFERVKKSFGKDDE